MVDMYNIYITKYLFNMVDANDIIYLWFFLRSVTMSTFKDWEVYKNLKKRGDTNSLVDVLKNKNKGDLIVRKII